MDLRSDGPVHSSLSPRSFLEIHCNGIGNGCGHSDKDSSLALLAELIANPTPGHYLEFSSLEEFWNGNGFTQGPECELVSASLVNSSCTPVRNSNQHPPIY
jgi:hypothetical protein